ncbi:MAG TPA: winged helix DNA-binding domain-containing protein [Steroidobacteraceae bacterium]|nr:winged helix DNA-binding domain-containing protein [Steroidobacteraceae bacterium]
MNRALLARQLLLRRSKAAPLAAIEQLLGLQAQVPNGPYIALWSRLAHFQFDELATLLTARRVVRLALMRSTIHLVSAADCVTLRPLMQPVLVRALRGTFGRRLAGMNLEEVAAAGRALVEAQPHTLGELGAALSKQWPGREPEALGNAARALVPLVQVPPRGIWGDSGVAASTSAEKWLGRRVAAKPSIGAVLLRYFAAFGPASVRDAQAWSGLTQLREVVERLRPQLRTFTDENGVELFDLPDAPRPSGDAEAPPRFLPEFDNVWLGHKDRARVLAAKPGRELVGSGGFMSGLVLLDGFVAGRWKIARRHRKATMAIERFSVMKRDTIPVAEEALRLLRVLAADAEEHDVQV